MKQGNFKLTGLSKGNRLTCEPIHNEDIFWVNDALEKDRFAALWDYMKDEKFEGKQVVLSYDYLSKDGVPINPKFVELLV